MLHIKYFSLETPFLYHIRSYGSMNTVVQETKPLIPKELTQ